MNNEGTSIPSYYFNAQIPNRNIFPMSPYDLLPRRRHRMEGSNRRWYLRNEKKEYDLDPGIRKVASYAFRDGRTCVPFIATGSCNYKIQ